MTCEECEQILLDTRNRTRPEGWMLKVSKASLVQEHVQNCPGCATKRTEVARLEEALNRLRVSTMQLEAPAGVERNLLDVFHREATRRHSLVWRGFGWRLVWLSAAALIFAAAGIQLYSSLRPHFVLKPENGNRVEIQPTFSPGLSSTAAEVFNENRGPVANNNIATISRRQVRKGAKPIAEPVARHAPIVPSDELSLNGGGSIVRVTLPFSSLSAMGLPVRPDLSETRVTADVWVDPFGAVVGIRLVPAKASAD
jgi:hypothetical protein